MTNALEPDIDALSSALEQVAARVIAHLRELPAQPASTPPDADYDRFFERTMPESGRPLEDLLALFFEKLLPAGVNTVSPGNLSYVNGGGLFHSAMASFITAATNRYVTYWAAAPGLAELETAVLRWFQQLVGFPESAGGVLLTGGSMANLTAIVAARREKLGEAFLDGTLYVSDQVHHSVIKSAIIAGFPVANIRVLPTDGQFELAAATVERAVADDRTKGLRPFMVVASAGTTSSGAVDDLTGLGTLSAREGLWFHVDAAYGGFFLLTEEGRRALRGIDRADSIALDPHKSLFLPYGNGCLLVRDPATLERAHSVHSDYIATIASESARVGGIDYADRSAEMTRDFRGLRIWLPIAAIGAAPFRSALDEKLDLARRVEAFLASSADFELVGKRRLSIVAFRATAPGLTAEQRDDLNRRVIDRVNQMGRVHLSSTVLDGLFTLRVCVLSFRAGRREIETCLTDLQEALRFESAAASVDTNFSE